MIRTFVKPKAAIVLVATLWCIVQYALAQAPVAFNPQKKEAKPFLTI